MNIPRQVLEQFELDHAKIEPITTGLINSSYKVETQNNTFVLQKQHSIFDADTVKIIEQVSHHLSHKGLSSLQIVRTKSGSLYTTSRDEIWRLLTFMPGKVIEVIDNPQTAYQAGRILGEFHQAMGDFSGDLDNKLRVHNTPKVYETFTQAILPENNPVILKLIDIIRMNLPELLLPSDSKTVVIHGDPKISNIIFSDDLLQAKAMIDLDLCQRNKLLFDLGDAFRSWCGNLEDDPNNSLSIEFFTAALQGYCDSCPLLDVKEAGLLVQAVKLIALELATRFLKDYFLDSYFGWDATKYNSRKEHNLARTIGQVHLFQDIVEKEKLLNQIISQTVR